MCRMQNSVDARQHHLTKSPSLGTRFAHNICIKIPEEKKTAAKSKRMRKLRCKLRASWMSGAHKISGNCRFSFRLLWGRPMWMCSNTQWQATRHHFTILVSPLAMRLAFYLNCRKTKGKKKNKKNKKRRREKRTNEENNVVWNIFAVSFHAANAKASRK